MGFAELLSLLVTVKVLRIEGSSAREGGRGLKLDWQAVDPLASSRPFAVP